MGASLMGSNGDLVRRRITSARSHWGRLLRLLGRSIAKLDRSFLSCAFSEKSAPERSLRVFSSTDLYPAKVVTHRSLSLKR